MSKLVDFLTVHKDNYDAITVDRIELKEVDFKSKYNIDDDTYKEFSDLLLNAIAISYIIVKLKEKLRDNK